MTAITNDISAFTMTFSRGPNEMDPVLLTIHVELSENFNRLQSVDIDLWPQNNPNWANWQDGHQTWVNIPRALGAGNVFETTLNLSPYATEADYVARVVNLTDDQGNFVNVTNTQLDELGLPSSAHLTNPFADNLPPEIQDITVGAITRLDDGSYAIPVDLTLKDDLSGPVGPVYIAFFDAYGRGFGGQPVDVGANGHASTQVILSKYAASGTYTLTSISRYDAALNGATSYHPEDHSGAGIVVLDNPDQDISPPTLDHLAITGSFDPVNGRPILHLSADLSDDKAGLQAFWARTYVNGAFNPNNERGTNATGHVDFDFALLSPSATGIYSFELTAVDSARNGKWWESDLRDPQNGLSKLGFNGDIHVFAPDEAGYVGATVQGGATDSIVFGLAMDDTLNAGKGADQLLGGAGNDTLNGGGGADELIGGDGNDTINAGSGNDLIVGGDGAGDDTYNGGSGVDTVKYTSARDGIVVDLAVGRASSRAGEDVAGIGTDKLAWIENVISGYHDDLISGNAAANQLQGMTGNDVLRGAGGNDRLEGGAGNDVLVGGAGNDRLVGGTGSDTADYRDAVAGVKVSLALSGAQDTVGAGIDTISGIENLSGGAFADSLEGSSSVNRLFGDAGNDFLRGLGNNDTLAGGTGNDRLIGGTGRDSLTGGKGSDTFVFDDPDFGGRTTTSADRIVDFSRAEGDRIDLKLVDANAANGATDNAFTFIGTKAFSKVPGELRYAQSSGNTYVSGDTDGNGTADFMIRLDGLHTLVSTDFVL